jgi:hypothetical protein
MTHRNSDMDDHLGRVIHDLERIPVVGKLDDRSSQEFKNREMTSCLLKNTA